MTFILSLFSLLGPVQFVRADESSLQDVVDRGTLLVGLEASYPPFEFRDTVTDEIIGFDPDIIKMIADEIGVDVEFVDVGWATIFTGLSAGSYDCIISAVTITVSREETMDFSRWYYRTAECVMVTVENPMSIPHQKYTV